MSPPNSRWVTLTLNERKKLFRLIMKILLPIFGVLTVVGIILLVLVN